MAYQAGGQGTYIFGDAATPTVVYDDELVNVQIIEMIETVTRPATYGKNVVENWPGASTYEMSIEWLGDPSDADSFFNMLQDARDDDGLCYFNILFQNGAASTTNKRFTGQIVVTNLTHNMTNNEFWQESQTFPIVNFNKASV